VEGEGVCPRESGSKDVGASWSVRLTAEGGREAWTVVDVFGTAMVVLETGTVAHETRAALRTQGRSAVESAVKSLGRGDEDPPARIVCSTDGCRADS
jgi:hypothetical protein